MNEDARSGNGGEDALPEVEDGIVDLAEIIEAAEGDRFRERGDIRRGDSRAIAPVGDGEADGFFEIAMVFATGVEMGIGEAIIDGLKAGAAAGVAEVGGLDGGGLGGEEEEA